MTAQIPLNGKRGVGKVALCDEADLALLSGFRWHLDRDSYPRTYVSDRRTTRAMHQMLTDLKGGHYADHINGDPLDNRRANLRPCTHQQNSYNRGAHRQSKTGAKR
jgi:HNH endonuclease